MHGPFKVLVADPPWQFNDKLPGETRGAEKNYSCLSSAELRTFLDLTLFRYIDENDQRFVTGQPIRKMIASDCVLFLWRVASMQREALDVVDAWGFTVKTELVWLKKTSQGNRWFGMGRTLRAEHETCLVATRGRPSLLSHAVRSTIVTDCEGFSAAVGRHSEKPDIFYHAVETLSAGPYLELFARKRRSGWVCLGDEVV